MGMHVVMIGGGHAHLESLWRAGDWVAKGHRVTLISPFPRPFYSGVIPAVLGGDWQASEAVFDLPSLCSRSGVDYIEASVIALDPRQRAVVLSDGSRIGYDVASCDTGGEILPVPGLDAAAAVVFRLHPLAQVNRLRRACLDMVAGGREPTVVVVGAGAGGVEVAGNLVRLFARAGSSHRVVLCSRGNVLERFSDRAGAYALKSLQSRGVDVRQGTEARLSADGCVWLGDECLRPDACVLATGSRPLSMYSKAGLAGHDAGGLLVDRCLRSVHRPEFLGGGDCIDFQPRFLEKAGVHAVREGPVLAANIAAMLRGGDLVAYRPQRRFMLILNLGDGHGLLCRGNWVLRGRWCLLVKTWIDARFLRRYRAR